MKLDKHNVEMYNVTITSDEYPEVFELAVYLRSSYVIEMLEQRLGREINWRNIIDSKVSRDEVTLQFYMELKSE
jgi:hypothetical protein